MWILGAVTEKCKNYYQQDDAFVTAGILAFQSNIKRLVGAEYHDKLKQMFCVSLAIISSSLVGTIQSCALEATVLISLALGP